MDFIHGRSARFMSFWKGVGLTKTNRSIGALIVKYKLILSNTNYFIVKSLTLCRVESKLRGHRLRGV